MKSQYSFKNREACLYVKITGVFNMDDFRLLPEVVVNKCLSEGKTKILVDASELKNTIIPTLERYFLGEKIASLSMYKIKTSVVWPTEDADRFTETVAVNRGSDFAVFNDMDKAREWLDGGDAKIKPKIN